MTKKNVLLFMAKTDMGGIETLFLNVLPPLTHDYNFFIAYYGEGENELREQFEQIGCKYYKLEINRYRHPIQFIKKLCNLICSLHVDIVHSNVGYSTFFVMIAAYVAKCPVRIAHSHNAVFGSLDNPLNRLFELLCKLTCHMMATARVNIGQLSARALFFKNDNSIWVPNGIDFSRFAFDSEIRKKTRAMLGLSESDVMILHIGRFAHEKNHEFLIRVFEEYHNDNPHSRLVLLGSGDLKDEIQQQVTRENLSDAVIFVGMVVHPESFYSAADCFILPSYSEGLGIVLIEAQINGLSCIASTGVDQGTNLTDYIEYLSLDEGPQAWAKQIPHKPWKHRDSTQYPELQKFDLANTIQMLRDLYEGKLHN